MKKLLVLLLMLSAVQIGIGQTEKGRILTGAILDLSGDFNSFLLAPANTIGVSFTTTKLENDFTTSDERRLTTFSFSPRMAYFLIDDFALGFNLLYLFQNSKPENSSSESQLTIYAGGPFVRYYFPLKKLRPFVEIYGVFGEIATTFSGFGGGEEQFKTSLTDLYGGAGIAYFIGKNVSLEAQLGYRALTAEDMDSPNNQKRTINSIGMRLGFNILFN